MGSAAARMRRIARKKAGICTKCGVNHAADGKAECLSCGLDTNEQSKRSRAKRKSKAVANGLCSACFRNKPSLGLLMCASCLILARAAYRKKYQTDGT